MGAGGHLEKTNYPEILDQMTNLKIGNLVSWLPRGATIIFCFLIIFSFQDQPNMMEDQTLTGINYIDGKAVKLAIADGKIAGQEVLSSDKQPEYHIAPGLIDVQINGYQGVDFSGPDLTVDGVVKATKALWKAGVTSYLPTVISSDLELIKKNFAILAEARQHPEIGKSIPGFHLEGPYISPVQGFRGAHLEKYLRTPNWEEFEDIQAAAENGIRIITLAPELPGAISFIRKCVDSGVIVSLGHHNGTADQIEAAVEAGAVMATHLGNGCANQINRHHNPLWPQLSNDRIMPSIIADGYHLTREEVRTFYKVKGPNNLLLVSDAIDLAGLPPGEYVRGERELLLTEGVVKLPKENVLAGAASPLDRCLNVVMNYTGCGIKEAVQMASTNPAILLNLDKLGTLDKGKRADIILFSMANNTINIHQTYLNGELVYTNN